MKVYRMCHPKRARDLSGRGAELYGGRWNPVGIPVLYTAANPSLALLEVLVHAQNHLLCQPLCLVTLKLPVNADEVDGPGKEDLPEDWRAHPAPLSLPRLGEKWLRTAEELVWRVPSATHPLEANFLINPRHPKITSVKTLAVETFDPDQRLVSLSE